VKAQIKPIQRFKNCWVILSCERSSSLVNCTADTSIPKEELGETVLVVEIKNKSNLNLISLNQEVIQVIKIKQSLLLKVKVPN
jgi:hypothetical protein